MGSEMCIRDRENSLNRFLKKESTKHFPAEGKATLCGLIVECDTSNGLAKKAEPFIRDFRRQSGGLFTFSQSEWAYEVLATQGQRRLRYRSS